MLKSNSVFSTRFLSVGEGFNGAISFDSDQLRVAGIPEQFEEQFWTRHSNPKSGWSRVATSPLLVYAVYRRKWRLLAAGLFWVVVDPVLFPPPESDDAWITRAVLAERWWVRNEENGTVGLSYPNVCNLEVR